jgi:para-nitrobenzyl esterase
MNMIFGSAGPQVTAEYPCLAYPTPQAAEIDALTGVTFTCPTRKAARALAEAQSEPVFRYFYTHAAAYGPIALLGAFHASELAYVFDAFAVEGYVPTPADTALSNHIQDYWGAFAATGDPGMGRDAMAWPSYRTEEEASLILDEPLSTRDAVEAAHCDFWDRLFP